MGWLWKRISFNGSQFFFDRKSVDSGAIPNQQVTHKPHKLITRKCKRGKVYYFFKENVWRLILLRFLLSVINNALVSPSKDKKRDTIVDACGSILNDFERKTNEI